MPPARLLERLSAGTRRLLRANNLGGASELSEALSYEIVERCFGRGQVALAKTETEIAYMNSYGGRTDYLAYLYSQQSQRPAEVRALPLGVSVTRAYERKGEGASAPRFELADAERLLRKKLGGIVETNATNMEGFTGQLLHAFAQTARVASLLRLAYHLLPQSYRANTVVLTTIVEADAFGLDRVIFANEELTALTEPLHERMAALDLAGLRRQRQQEWRAMAPLARTRRPAQPLW